MFASVCPPEFTYLRLINVQPKDTLELSTVQRCLPSYSAAEWEGVAAGLNK